ncbi:HNH endonuclease [Thermoproteota archaeon]
MRHDLLIAKVDAERKLQEVTTEIVQLRRGFKIEGYSTRQIRKLTELEKKGVIAMRDNKCEQCGSTVDLSVHHKKPLSHGGTNDEDNLEVLCLNCHKKYHRI